MKSFVKTVYFVVFGLNASFKPSPTKLIDKMVNVIKIAGGTHIHGLFCKTSVSLARCNIFPQLGISIGTPTPIKLSPVSATTYVPNSNVACTIIMVTMLETICLNMIVIVLVSIDLAASTYSYSFSDDTLLRTILDTDPQASKLKTMINIQTPVVILLPCMIEFNTMIKTMKGMVKTKSLTRMRKSSTIPPAQPDMAPTAEPIIVTATIEISTICKDTLPPCIDLRKTSRPSLSVPNQCSLDGGRLAS